jgi:hypothetical protein
MMKTFVDHYLPVYLPGTSCTEQGTFIPWERYRPHIQFHFTPAIFIGMNDPNGPDPSQTPTNTHTDPSLVYYRVNIHVILSI